MSAVPIFAPPLRKALVLRVAPTLWGFGFNTAEIARRLMNLHPGIWKSWASCEAEVCRALAEHRGGERG